VGASEKSAGSASKSGDGVGATFPNVRVSGEGFGEARKSFSSLLFSFAINWNTSRYSGREATIAPASIE
jgi:hypothetical protein